jgi:cytochrome b
MSAAERLLKRHQIVDVPSRRLVLAWDLPTRLFKWALVLLVITAWVSSGFDDPNMTVHKAAGYGILTLVVYRIFWGIVGGSTARFSTFVKSPAAVWAHLRAVHARTERPYLGHNPVGGLMIVALLVACAIQVMLGLVSSDGVLAAGPFADAVGDVWSSRAAALHARWFYMILALALVHIAVNLFHQFVKRDNLIGAMVTGRKDARPYADGDEAVEGSPLIAMLCLCVAVAVVTLAVILPGGQFFSGL